MNVSNEVAILVVLQSLDVYTDPSLSPYYKERLQLWVHYFPGPSLR